MSWRIAALSEHPECVETLARWHHAQWGELMAPWSLDEARAELGESARSLDGFPATLVAFDADGALLGSVSLLAKDAPEFAQYSPWLASLYVVAAARGQGLGSALVSALMAHAERLGIGPLYLFTPGSPEIYQRLGWSVLGLRRLHNQEVILMHTSHSATPAA